ncbi:odorant receptor 4-like [Xylocopa sonorina]|uniref:odorant receptor 4-like n=1 Tax=Xylocopa sonorina TaxID=1818115 RepID=UPI00403B104B
MIGVWPIPATSSSFSKLLQRLEHVLAYFLFFLIMVPSVLHVFLKEKSNKKRLKLMGPIINSGMQIFKYTILLYRYKEIQNALEAIRQDWINATVENRLIFHSKAKIGRRVVLISAVTMYSSGICYRTIVPLLRGTIVTPDNVTIRPLPCPGYFGFLNVQRTPFYEIMFTLQVMSGLVSYSVIGGTCGISTILVLHACSMLNILVNKIKALVDKTDMTEVIVRRRIKQIVEYQTKIKRFFNNVETIMEYICLTEMVGGSCLICLAEYYFLMEWQDRNTTATFVCIMLGVSFTFCVFILCYIGQLLVDENKIVGQTSCTVNWYRLPVKHARCLTLVIAMSNYPMKLKAGKMIEVSLATFTDVMKMSIGYLNLLREVV